MAITRCRAGYLRPGFSARKVFHLSKSLLLTWCCDRSLTTGAQVTHKAKHLFTLHPFPGFLDKWEWLKLVNTSVRSQHWAPLTLQAAEHSPPGECLACHQTLTTVSRPHSQLGLLGGLSHRSSNGSRATQAMVKPVRHAIVTGLSSESRRERQPFPLEPPDKKKRQPSDSGLSAANGDFMPFSRSWNLSVLRAADSKHLPPHEPAQGEGAEQPHACPQSGHLSKQLTPLQGVRSRILWSSQDATAHRGSWAPTKEWCLKRRGTHFL